MNTLKPTLLFPGQGSQTVGMGRNLYEKFPIARSTFEEADEALGFALSRLIFEGPEEDLKLTEHTQPAILTVSVAAYRVLMQSLALHGIAPSFAAGHSLGEYSAHVAAGTLTFADAVRTVRARGQFMQQAVPPGVGAMAAILGIPADRVREFCTQASTDTELVAPANLNSPEQTVISGVTAAVQRAMDLCKQAGAKRAIPLPVSAPFHCALMQPAQDRLAHMLDGIVFSAPKYPVACNVDARLLDHGPEIKHALIRQVTGAVRWVECLQLLISEGATHLIEVGPGKVLTGLTRQILGKAGVTQVSLNVEDSASLEKAVQTLISPPESE
jgi:[acyl-carrier-protein] S-malonyltransferase